MSIRKLLSVTSLVCMMPLAACEEESDDSSAEDASTPGAAADAGSAPIMDGNDFGSDGGVIGTPGADGSTAPVVMPSADGGTALPPPHDAGAPVVSDGGSTSPGNTPSGTVPHFFLPTGEPTNTAEPAVEIDGQNNVHTAYPAYVRGGAFYAFCSAASCKSPADAKHVEFETDGTVDTAMLALTSDGRPRILLTTYLSIYYAQCDRGCTERSNWSLVQLINQGSDVTATGESLALDPAGNPRFIMHGRRNPYDFFTPKVTDTRLASCDANCQDPASWSFQVIAEKEIWEGSHLRYDASGRAHVATTVFNYADTTQGPLLAYLTCQGACNTVGTWSGTGFGEPVVSLTDVVSISPTISLALTKAGQPRVAMLIKDNQGKRSIGYAECDADCAKSDTWRGINLWGVDSPIGAGIDLALTSNNVPVFAHTINYNIVLTYCQEEPCTANGAKWESTNVERSADIPADTIFLEWNCTVGAWFLHNPSLALTSDDKPRVGYQSRDISGGVSRPDPLKPRCTAGTDMTFSRLALLPSYIE